MNSQEIEKKLRQLVIEVLDLEVTPEELQATDLIKTYGLNSVDALELLMCTENEFDIEIDEEDLTSELVDSVANLAAYVENKIPNSVNA